VLHKWYRKQRFQNGCNRLVKKLGSSPRSERNRYENRMESRVGKWDLSRRKQDERYAFQNRAARQTKTDSARMRLAKTTTPDVGGSAAQWLSGSAVRRLSADCDCDGSGDCSVLWAVSRAQRQLQK